MQKNYIALVAMIMSCYTVAGTTTLEGGTERTAFVQFEMNYDKNVPGMVVESIQCVHTRTKETKLIEHYTPKDLLSHRVVRQTT